MFSGCDFQICNLPVFLAVRKELCQEFIMYWKQESMENEVSSALLLKVKVSFIELEPSSWRRKAHSPL